MCRGRSSLMIMRSFCITDSTFATHDGPAQCGTIGSDSRVRGKARAHGVLGEESFCSVEEYRGHQPPDEVETPRTFLHTSALPSYGWARHTALEECRADTRTRGKMPDIPWIRGHGLFPRGTRLIRRMFLWGLWCRCCGDISRSWAGREKASLFFLGFAAGVYGNVAACQCIRSQQ